MNILIRTALRSDAQTIAEFNAAMALETEHLQLDVSLLLLGVNGLFDNPEKGFYLIAEHDGVVVGQMMVTYEWSDWRNGIFWWIQSVYVPPEYRVQKIYRTLYEHTAALAKEQENVCGLRLYVDKENDRAHRVYEKLGMTLTNYDMYEVDFVLQR
jgi:GNAT superfamily N-acetyltransferase